MRYRTLGNSGCAVSALCLGTMTFGTETAEDGAHDQLDRFVEAGGNLVDTADVYTAGAAEEIIGRWLASRPSTVTDSVVLATKGRFAMGSGPNDTGLSSRHLAKALDASLRRLGVQQVDLYQVHAWDPWTPLPETLRTLDGFVRSGKTEWEIVPAALDAGLGLLPWSPLGGGWLTGKYQRDERPTGSTRLGEDPGRGMEAWERRGTERTWNIIEAVQRIAEGRGVSMAQVALSWVTNRAGVTSTILGARTLEQHEDNLGSVEVVLSDEDVAALDEASDLHATDYPYGDLALDQRDRDLAGG